jgi:hypothetical protein
VKKGDPRKYYDEARALTNKLANPNSMFNKAKVPPTIANDFVEAKKTLKKP